MTKISTIWIPFFYIARFQQNPIVFKNFIYCSSKTSFESLFKTEIYKVYCKNHITVVIPQDVVWKQYAKMAQRVAKFISGVDYVFWCGLVTSIPGFPPGGPGSIFAIGIEIAFVFCFNLIFSIDLYRPNHDYLNIL